MTIPEEAVPEGEPPAVDDVEDPVEPAADAATATGPSSAAEVAAPGRPRWFLFFVLTAAVIAVDQLAKAWVAASFQIGVPVPVLGDAVRITVSHNAGALFGLIQGSALVFGVASLAIVGLIVWYESRAGQSLLLSIALGLLMGGAVGNLVDRLRQGYVVDFVDAGVGAVRWFTFNVSDVAIDGAILLLILLTLLPPRADRPVPAERPA